MCVCVGGKNTRESRGRSVTGGRGKRRDGNIVCLWLENSAGRERLGFMRRGRRLKNDLAPNYLIIKKDNTLKKIALIVSFAALLEDTCKGGCAYENRMSVLSGFVSPTSRPSVNMSEPRPAELNSAGSLLSAVTWLLQCLKALEATMQ